jgi:two-component system NtrC family sensor kinase
VPSPSTKRRTTQAPAPLSVAGLGGAILDALPISLYVVDRDLRVVAWNSLREKGPIGKPRQAVLGRHLKDVLSPQGFRATVPILEQVFGTGEPHEETLEPQGGTRIFHVRRLPVRTGRVVTHVLSWFDDVTEQRAVEMHLIASDRLAYLGQLVAGVAHEVSNPLASVAGCAEVLTRPQEPGAQDPAEAREFRDSSATSVARCERIVRSLDSARPDQGHGRHRDRRVGTGLPSSGIRLARIHVVPRIPRDLPPTPRAGFLETGRWLWP